MSRESGFTLIELMVGLAIASLLLLSGRAIFEALANQEERLNTLVRRSDAEANGDLLLRSIMWQAVRNANDTLSFRGSVRSVHLTSRCSVPGGWTEPCVVDLELITPDGRGQASDCQGMRMSTSTGERLSLSFDQCPRGFLYLIDASASGMWISTWYSGRDLPKAVGVIRQRDTLAFRVGASP